jgi:hypothetical protein
MELSAYCREYRENIGLGDLRVVLLKCVEILGGSKSGAA